MRARAMIVCLAGLCLLACVPSTWAADAWLALGATAEPAEPAIAVIADTPSLLQLQVDIPGLNATDRQTPDGFDTYLAIPGHGHTLEIGAPAVPVVRCVVEIPLGATFEAEALAGGAHTFTLGSGDLRGRLFPVQPPLSKNEDRGDLTHFQRDPTAYSRPGLIPEGLVRVTDMGQMRGYRLALIEVHPVAHDPVSGELLCHERVDVILRMSGADLAATQQIRERYASPSFDTVLGNVAVNHETFLGGPRDLPALPIGLLIITADTYVGSLTPLAEWKTLKGYQTTIATTSQTGSTKELIKAYIQNAYDTWEVPPTWVLLVGDTHQIPNWTGTASGTESDLYYCTLAGTDYLPEIAIGRFPARTEANVATMVEKVVDAEKLILANGIAFTNRVAWLAASDLSGFAENTHNYLIDTYFGPAGMENIKIYERLGGSTQDARNALNLGVVECIYSGHGSDNSWASVPFTQTDIRNLTNLDMYPFVSSHACETGSYGITECFGETWVLAPSKGGVAFWGASNLSYWDEDDILERRAWDSYWTEDFYDLGSFCHEGLLHVYTYYGGGGQSRYYFEMYNLLGDPSTDMWCTPPNAMEAAHPAVVFIGQSELTVSVTEGVTPLADALVCVYMPGETYEVGYTNALGQVTLQLDPAPMVPGTMYVTATKHDHAPYFGSLEVMPASGPLVVFDSYAVDDDTNGGSLGNGDGGADAGELLELRVTLENVGVDPAVNVIATLSIDDPCVGVLDPIEGFGTILPGGTATCWEDYDLRIAGTCPSGHVVHCALHITAEGRPDWEAAFNLPVEAPALTISRVIVDDSIGGDGNGHADPGETCDYRVFVTNTGTEDAVSAGGDLIAATDMVTILQGSAGAALVAPGNEVELLPAYSLSISPAAPEPEVYTLWLECAADWQYRISIPRELPVGGLWDDFEAGVGSWTHAVGSAGFVDQWHRSSERNHSPGGSWSWKQGDTGTGTYANLCDGCLVTPAVPLANQTRLRFWHWMDAEVSQSYPGYCYDGGLVEISVNGGAWQRITPEGGYPYRIRTGGTPGPFPAETPVYSGTADWAAALFVVDGYSGTAQFRFRFGSDGATAREGWHIDDVEVSGTSGSAQGTPDQWQPLALQPLLMQNAPNPFRPATLIAFELPSAQNVTLQVFDAQGRWIRTLARGAHAAGLYRITWDGAAADGALQSSGVYYYRLETDQGSFTRRMTLVR